MPAEFTCPPPFDAACAALAQDGRPVARLEPLAGDSSTRRYARVRFAPGARAGETDAAILVHHPAELADVPDRFLRTGELLRAAGVRVPRILADGGARAVDDGGRWLLVEDLGPHTVWQRAQAQQARHGALDPVALDWDGLEPHYADALDVIARLRRVPMDAVAALNPPLDRALLTRELAQTWDAFLTPRGVDGALADDLRDALDAVIDRVVARPQVVCHRDFMVRNLVPLPRTDGALGVIDHQDTRLGPDTYDLASLLHDSIFPSDARVDAWIDDAATRLRGVDPDAAPDAPDRWRDAVRCAAVQRTLKALGTFARCVARGSQVHGQHIPGTQARALALLGQVAETQHLAAPLAAALGRS
ncbi:MAG: phosphotransferase [Acidobacteriota bacterium]